MDTWTSSSSTELAIPSLDEGLSEILQPPLPQTTTMDLHRRDGKGRPGGRWLRYGSRSRRFHNDGWPDIFIASVTKNHLYHNNHDGTFTDVTDKAGVGSPMYKGKKMWSAAAGWFDYKQRRQTGFVSWRTTCVWEVNKDPVCLSGGRLRSYCHPKFYRAASLYALPQ